MIKFDWRAIRYWQKQPKRDEPDLTSEFIDYHETARADWHAEAVRRQELEPV